MTKVDKIDSDYVSKAQGAAIGIATQRLGNIEILGGGGCCCIVFTIPKLWHKTCIKHRG